MELKRRTTPLSLKMFYASAEPFLLNRLAILIILTVAVGGVGFLSLITICPRAVRSDPLEILSISISLGIASIVVVIGGMSALNLSFSKIAFVFLVFILIAICAGLGVIFRDKTNFLRGNQLDFSAIRFFLLFLLFSLVVRDLQTYNIFVPNWVDGLTHTTRLQKFVLRDFIPFDRVYPSGFYSLALILYKFGMGTLPETVLVSGQWLAAVAAMNMYPLAKRYLGHSVWGNLSVFVYSFCLLFPSHLLAWGRYPFLLGLALLLPATLTTLDWLSGYDKNYAIAFVFVAALALSHYGAFLIWLSFVLVYLTLEGKPTIKCQHPWLRIVFLTLPLFLVFIPRVANILDNPAMLKNITNRSDALEFDDDVWVVVRLVWEHDMFFIGIWAAGIVLSFLRREKIFFILALWPLTFYLLTWIQYELLGFSVTSYANLVIFISIPLAFSFGYVTQQIDSILDRLDVYRSLKSRAMKKRLIPLLLILCACVFGVFLSFRDFNSDTVLFNADDAATMTWLKDNTPADAVILINSFIWGDKLMPSDGGGWINLLTGRQAIYPAMGEFYDACEFINKNKVSYIYLGKSPLNGLFSLKLDDFFGLYKVVYETKNVTIASVSCP